MVDIPDGRFFAIKQMLQQQMQAAIDLYTQKLGLAADSVAGVETLHATSLQVAPSAISMHRKENYTRVLYRCAVALKLANVCHQSAIDLATGLAACWQEVTQECDTQVAIDFTVEVVPPGWIDFHLTDQGIATWLQYLISLPLESYSLVTAGDRGSRGSNSFPQSLFSVQYAHARCCSLLRLGHREGLITLGTHTPVEKLHATSVYLQVVEPDPIPWMDGDRQLHLAHQAERHLIAQILEVLDELGGSGQPTGVKLADAMQSFYSRVRIFDEVKTQKPQLAQARLGLVAVTRLILHLLLEYGLGVCAPEEL